MGYTIGAIPFPSAGVGAPHIRFYLGAPLILPGGARIGTFCLIDTRPRALDELDQALLRTLRDLAVAELTGAGGGT